MHMRTPSKPVHQIKIHINLGPKENAYRHRNSPLICTTPHETDVQFVSCTVSVTGTHALLGGTLSGTFMSVEVPKFVGLHHLHLEQKSQNVSVDTQSVVQPPDIAVIV